MHHGRKGGGSAGEARGLPLTERQLEIIDLVALGHTNREIAELLGIRAATVKRHLERIYDRAGVRTRAAVTAKVMAGGASAAVLGARPPADPPPSALPR